jgi:hypothetical protein
MSKYFIKGNKNYVIKQLLNVSNKVLDYKYNKSTIIDEIGIIANTKGEIEMYPITDIGETIIKSYLEIPEWY